MKADKKSLFLVSHYRPLIGGALTVYDGLAKHSAGNISILTAKNSYWSDQEVEGWQEFDAAASYPIWRVNEMRPPLLAGRPGLVARTINFLRGKLIDRRILNKVAEIVKRDSIDVICVCALDSNGSLVPKLQKLTVAKVILYIHGEEVAQEAHSQRAERRRTHLLEKADAIVTVSEFTAKVMRQKYAVPAHKIHLQTNGVDTSVFTGNVVPDARSEFNLPLSPFVLSCGRLVARKGFDKLLDAWPSVLRKHPDAKLLLGGEGPLRPELEARAEAAQITGSVLFCGWMPEEKLAAAMGLADIFVMPNRDLPDGDTEGFGLEFIEAGAMGTCSIGGMAGGVPEAVRDGETGLLVDGNNTDEIADAIIQLISDKGFNQKLSKGAQQFARSQSWQGKADAFQAYLQTLCDDTVK